MANPRFPQFCIFFQMDFFSSLCSFFSFLSPLVFAAFPYAALRIAACVCFPVCVFFYFFDFAPLFFAPWKGKKKKKKKKKTPFFVSFFHPCRCCSRTVLVWPHVNSQCLHVGVFEKYSRKCRPLLNFN